MVNKMLVAIVAVIVVIAVMVPAVYILTQKTAKKNHAPIAAFTVSATKVAHNKTLSFIGATSTDPDKKDIPKLNFTWAVSDGGSGTGMTYIHKFIKDGNFTVTLTVSDGKLTNATSKKIEVYNVPPEITGSLPFGNTASMKEGGSLLFNITVYDENLDTLSVKWVVDNKTTSETTSKYNFTADFNSSGMHSVKAVLTDGKAQASKTWDLTVIDVNRAPVLTQFSPASDMSVPEGGSQAFTATAMDPDGNVLTCTWKLDGKVQSTTNDTKGQFKYMPDFDANGTHTVMVNFTDGKLGVEHVWKALVPNVNRAPVIVSVTPKVDVTINETEQADFAVNATDPDKDTLTYDWTFDGVSQSSVKTYSYISNYSSEGKYVVIVKVSDHFLTVEHKWNVTVNNLNRAPTAVAFVDIDAGFIDDVISFDGTWSTDPDGDTLTYHWDFGDGNTTTGDIVTHVYKFAALFTVNLTVTDTHGASGSAELSVNISKPIPRLSQLFNVGPFDHQLTQLVVGDVDNDGSKEMVFGENNGTDVSDIAHGCIFVLDLATQAIEWQSGDIGGAGDIALANLDGDPALEIVVGVTTKSVSSGFSSDIYGKLLMIDGISHVIEKQSGNIGEVTLIQIADIDGAAQKEIIVGYSYNFSVNWSTFTISFKGGMAVYDNTLTQIWNSTGWGMTGVMFVGNMDADAAIEIVTFSLKSVSGLGTDQNISIFEWASNKPVQKNNVTGANAVTPNAYAIADIDGDGNMEVIVGESNGNNGLYSGKVVAFTSTMSKKWETGDVGGVEALCVNDTNQDSKQEVLVGVLELEDQNTYEDTGRLYVLDKDGGTLWNTSDIGKVVVLMTGDLNGDSMPEIVAGAIYYDDGLGAVNSTIHIYSGTTHEEIGQVQGMHTLFWMNFLVLDVDGNGNADLLFVDWDEVDSVCNIFAYGFP